MGVEESGDGRRVAVVGSGVSGCVECGVKRSGDACSLSMEWEDGVGVKRGGWVSVSGAVGGGGVERSVTQLSVSVGRATTVFSKLRVSFCLKEEVKLLRS